MPTAVSVMHKGSFATYHTEWMMPIKQLPLQS